MELTHWNKKEHSLQIPQIDLQHEHIFNAISEAYNAILQDEEPSIIEKNLNKLVVATRSHFDHEEYMMLKHLYKNIDSHIGRHMVFNKMLSSLIYSFRHSDYASVINSLIYLSHWLMEHVLTADNNFREHLDATGYFSSDIPTD